MGVSYPLLFAIDAQQCLYRALVSSQFATMVAASVSERGVPGDEHEECPQVHVTATPDPEWDFGNDLEAALPDLSVMVRSLPVSPRFLGGLIWQLPNPAAGVMGYRTRFEVVHEQADEPDLRVQMILEVLPSTGVGVGDGRG